MNDIVVHVNVLDKNNSPQLWLLGTGMIYMHLE